MGLYSFPTVPQGWCAACGKELPLDDWYVYEGRHYHLGCLRAMLKRRHAALLRLKSPRPEQIDEMMELEEDLKALGAM
jgi:hypothetical protein